MKFSEFTLFSLFSTKNVKSLNSWLLQVVKLFEKSVFPEFSFFHVIFMLFLHKIHIFTILIPFYRLFEQLYDIYVDFFICSTYFDNHLISKRLTITPQSFIFVVLCIITSYVSIFFISDFQASLSYQYVYIEPA